MASAARNQVVEVSVKTGVTTEIVVVLVREIEAD
jgi:hypothetical protein